MNCDLRHKKAVPMVYSGRLMLLLNRSGAVVAELGEGGKLLVFTGYGIVGFYVDDKGTQEIPCL